MRPHRHFVLAAIIQVVAFGVAAGQAPTLPIGLLSYRQRLLGVFDVESGAPIEGARVTDVLSRISALTTHTGTVALVYLPEGGSLIRIEKIGYQPTTLTVEISPSDTVPLTLLLNPLAQTLPAIITRDSAPHYIGPGLRAFEDRRRLGLGHFVSEAELRHHDNEKMTTLIRRFPGLRIFCPKSGMRSSQCWAVSVRLASKHAILGGSCDVDVYMDGVASGDNDLEKLAVNEFGGVEYYAGSATIPTQYNKTGSSCGVLLLWTRER